MLQHCSMYFDVYITLQNNKLIRIRDISSKIRHLRWLAQKSVGPLIKMS